MNIPAETRALEFEQLLYLVESEQRLDERMALAWRIFALMQAGTTPFIYGRHVRFVHWAAACSVALAGDWTRWKAGEPLRNVAGTPLWYSGMDFPTDARLQYKFVVDGNWCMDPLNPLASQEGFGRNSEFLMPGYHTQSFLAAPPGIAVRAGAIRRFMIHSRVLQEQRELFVYTPPLAQAERSVHSLPLLLIHDGAEAQSLGHYHTILDNLQAVGSIPPLAAVFVSPKQRNHEYALNEGFMRFCWSEALPRARAEVEQTGFRLRSGAQWRCVAGASLGGLLATAMSLRKPETFGAFIAQSPSYWWHNGAIFQDAGLGNAAKVRAVLHSGTVCDAFVNTRRMHAALQERGAAVRYIEVQEGHTWGNWRNNFAAAVRAWLELAAEQPENKLKEP